MPLPKTIKVGCFDIKVQTVRKLVYDRGRIGEYAPGDLTIDIEETSSPQR